MRLTDDYHEESNRGISYVSMGLGVSAVIFLILAVVLILNKEPKRQIAPVVQTEEAGVTAQAENGLQEEKSYADKTVEELISGSTLTADQLDLWEGLEENPQVEENKKKPNKSSETSAISKDTKEKEEDPTKGGTLTRVMNDKGKEEWIHVNPYLKKNNYDYSGLVFQTPLMKYYENSTLLSYMGVDVSKNQGIIDYNKLKKAGVQFVMLRLGTRGYGSGQLTLDEYFHDNMKGASDAGLSIGAYFFSQAITEEEAVEEANLVIENLKDYQVSYPIAFHMESVENDTARIDDLTKEERTKITKAFLKTIKEAGYKPVLYGSKEWLILKLDLLQLIEFDVWLAQEQDIPDYPYKFSMWQYTTNGKIDGISGKANLNISFIDYDLK